MCVYFTPNEGLGRPILDVSAQVHRVRLQTDRCPQNMYNICAPVQQA